MKNVIAPVKNLSRVLSLVRWLVGREPSTPGMALLHGASGTGKTTACTEVAEKFDAVHVRACATWTPLSMLSTIARELGEAPHQRCSPMLDTIVRKLRETGQPLIVDEGDYVAESNKLSDTLRDIHDLSTVPVVLVGMDAFKRRIARREQLARRIAQWVDFQPADLEDARILADSLCEVGVSDDLLVHLHDVARGSIGRIKQGLLKIEKHGLGASKGKVGLKDWGKRALTFTADDVPAGVV